jgi:hypothetical protein
MHRLHKALIVAAGLTFIVALVAVGPGGQAVAQGLKNVAVEVVNGPDRPIPTFDVQNPACLPFQIELVLGPPNGQTHQTESFVVPRNRRLVIEHVSVSGSGDGFIRTHVTTTANGVVAEHFLVNVPQGTTASGTPVFHASQPTRWYADPGTEVQVTNSITPANGTPRMPTWT